MTTNQTNEVKTVSKTKLNIAKIKCDMTQEFEEDGIQRILVLEAEFLFYDYAPTVVE